MENTYKDVCPVTLVVLLYARAIRDVKENNTSHAIKILDELKASLNLENLETRVLAGLLADMYEKAKQDLISGDKEKALHILVSLHAAWQTLDSEMKSKEALEKVTPFGV